MFFRCRMVLLLLNLSQNHRMATAVLPSNLAARSSELSGIILAALLVLVLGDLSSILPSLLFPQAVFCPCVLSPACCSCSGSRRVLPELCVPSSSSTQHRGELLCAAHRCHFTPQTLRLCPALLPSPFPPLLLL